MNRRRAPRLAAALVVAATLFLVWPGSRAQAEEARRIAVLVGNNQGPRNRPTLSYAERDATDLAAVLGELGGFRADDIHLFRGSRLPQVRAALAGIRAQVASIAAADVRVVLLFFFSGHSDGEALQLFDERWAFSDVRSELKEMGVTVRIAIVDSCHSGAMLAQKGGKPGPSFDIRFTDDLATSGEAVLTSTAAHELALESGELSASFFSHHLVSGLRGAADSSGDGRVTLGEAYRYAFENTLAATANTTIGPQHAGYDFRLAGRGELVLTDLRTPAAKLTLPTGFDRILILESTRRRMIADVTGSSARLIALPAGRYRVVGRRAGRAFEASVNLPNGESRQLAATELVAVAGAASATKGDFAFVGGELGPDAVVAPQPWSIGVGAGVNRGVATATPWLGVVHAQARLGERWGLALRADVATKAAAEFRETQASAGAGVFLGARRGRLAAQVSWTVNVGTVVQAITSEEMGSTFWTWFGSTGPAASATVDLSPNFAAGLTAGADAMVLRRNDALAAGFRPAVYAMVEWHR